VENFWLYSHAPLEPWLRRVVLVALLVLNVTLHHSPLSTADLAITSPPLYHLPVSVIPGREVALPTVAMVRWGLVGAWACAAAGALEPYSSIATALGYGYVWWVTVDIGAGHHTHTATFGTLLSLALLSNPRLSRALQRGAAIANTGFARQIATAICSHCLFAAGLTKLRAGFDWCSGRALGQILEQKGYCPTGQCVMLPWLRELVRGSDLLLAAMSTSTLLLELSSPLMLFFGPARSFIALIACSFHLGVLTLMGANFTSNAICYLAVIDWEWIATRTRRRGVGESPGPVGGERGACRVPPRVAAVCAVGGTCLLALLAAPVAMRWDRWPFLTSYPMFGGSENGTHVGGFARADYGDLPSMSRIAESLGLGASKMDVQLSVLNRAIEEQVGKEISMRVKLCVLPRATPEGAAPRDHLLDDVPVG